MVTSSAPAGIRVNEYVPAGITIVASVVAFASMTAARSVHVWFPTAVSHWPSGTASSASPGVLTVKVGPAAPSGPATRPSKARGRMEARRIGSSSRNMPRRRPGFSYTRPWSIMESATLRNPAMFAPLT